MPPIWAIESRVDGLDTQAISTAVTQLGLKYQILSYPRRAESPNYLTGTEKIRHDANVIFTGTMKLFHHLARTQNWRPLGWCDFEKLSYSKYSQHFRPFMLNQNFRILSIDEAVSQEAQLYRDYALKHKFFVRPNSVDKLFTGQVVDIDSFSHFLKSKTEDHSRKILVSHPKPIEREWRLFIANDQIVDGCQYSIDGQFDFQPKIPSTVCDFVSHVFSQTKWRPHPLFVMDVCQSIGELRILEFNSYNCSGLLECSVELFVQAATKQAEIEFAARIS